MKPDTREEIPAIDEMRAMLTRLGWKRWRNRSTIWQSPDGRLFRGPYLAWKVAIEEA